MERTWHCYQCGEATESLHEGYCAECCAANQAALDAHNAAFLEWQNMTDVQRDRRIREAIDRGGYVIRVE